jgi:hypothetical protein
LDLFLAVGVATAVVFVARSALILFQQYVQFRVAETAGARLSTRLLAVDRPRAPGHCGYAAQEPARFT